MNEKISLNAPFEDHQVRPATISDTEIINEFFDAMSGETRSFFNRRDYNRRGILKWCASPEPTRKYWICLKDGVISGCFFFLDYDTGVPMLGIAVRDDLKGQHFGRSLINAAIEVARSEGKGGIQLTTHVANVRAQVLYEEVGFKHVGTFRNGVEFFYLLNFRQI